LKNLNKIQDLLNSCTDKSKTYEKQYSDATNILDDLRKGTEHLIKVFQKTILPSGSYKAKPPAAAAAEVEAPVEGAEAGAEDAAPVATEEQPEPPKAAPRQTASAKARAEFISATESLLGTHGVTDNNLLSCLGLIEQKTNEVLTLHYLFNIPKKSGSSQGEDKGETKEVIIPVGGVGGLLGQGPMVPIGNISIIAPNTEYVLIIF
jgi:hypothetical protein